MAILTDDERAALEKNPDTAAIAKKLQDMGDYIPKTRFDEVNEERKRHEAALAKIESDRKAADDERARKAGEFEKLDAERNARIAELEKTAANEKAVADQYRAEQRAKVDAFKKDFGDDWLPEYESFSVASLDKIAAQRAASRTNRGKPDTGRHASGVAGKPFADMTPVEQQQYIDRAKRGEFTQQ